jgi:hypothetical protein
MHISMHMACKLTLPSKCEVVVFAKTSRAWSG